MKSRDPIVYIAIPSGHSAWSPTMALSLAMLLTFERERTHLVVDNLRSSLILNARETMVQKAIDGGATHVLFIDSDMSFPHDTLSRLLAADRPLIACACPVKKLPSNSSALIAPGVMLDVRSHTGIMPVWRVGTGIMLLATALVRRLPQPRFLPIWIPKERNYAGEDWSFLSRLVEATGVVPYVECDLSKEIGHSGEYLYTWDDIPFVSGANEDAEQEQVSEYGYAYEPEPGGAHRPAFLWPKAGAEEGCR